MVTFVVGSIIAFGFGFALARVGVWIRFTRIEAELRGLQLAAYELSMMQHTKDVPAEWVESQVANIVNRQFH